MKLFKTRPKEASEEAKTLHEIAEKQAFLDRACISCNTNYGPRSTNDCTHCGIKQEVAKFATRKMNELTGTYEF